MRVAVLGTGIVGRTLGTKLVELGHEVRMGSRTPDNEEAAEWAAEAGASASQGTFADAARSGSSSLELRGRRVRAAGARGRRRENLEGKTLLDVATRSTSRRACRRGSRSATTTASASRSSASSPTRES